MPNIPEEPIDHFGQATRRSAERLDLEFLLEASRILASSLDYHETLWNVAQLAIRRVADWCVVDVLEQGEIRRVAVAHADPRMLALAREYARQYPPRPDEGVAVTLKTGESQLFVDIGDDLIEARIRDPNQREFLHRLDIRSAMIVPMTARNRTLGAITCVSSESGRRYDENDVALALELASRSALAVDNARLFAEAERRAREESALRTAAHAVASAFSVEEVIHKVAVSSLDAVDAEGAFVERIDAQATKLEVVAAAGDFVPMVGFRLPFEGSLAQLVLQAGHPLLLERIRGAAPAVAAPVVDACGDCSAIAIPLQDAGESIGALFLLRSPGRERFREDELERARAFGDLAALAFRKIHLLEEAERKREELERAADSRDRLIRGFSHDLRNPLGAADGYLSLIEQRVFSDPDRLELSISRARRSIRSAIELIENLVELARAEAGQIEVNVRAVDVREIVRELTEEYRAQAEIKGLRIGWTAPEELPVLRSDAARVSQILGNLLSNAIKYTAAGRADLRVAAPSQPIAGWYWMNVTVSDTGPGIPADKVASVFEEFRRLEPQATGGVGLGLAISRRIADVLGGRITLESEVGKGSHFTLWLPVSPAPPAFRGSDLLDSPTTMV